MVSTRGGARLPVALRRGAAKAVRAVLLAIALAMSAIGIPVPWRVAPQVPHSQAETVVDPGEPEPPPPVTSPDRS